MLAGVRKSRAQPGTAEQAAARITRPIATTNHAMELASGRAPYPSHRLLAYPVYVEIAARPAEGERPQPPHEDTVNQVSSLATTSPPSAASTRSVCTPSGSPTENQLHSVPSVVPEAKSVGGCPSRILYR